MKKIIFLYSYFLCLVATYGQAPVSIDSIYNVIKQRNVHSKNANWMQIDKGFAEKLIKAKNDIDSIKSFMYVFEQLKDYHSAIIYKGNYFTNYPTFNDSTLKYLMPLVNLANQQVGKFRAEAISDQFLYLQVPGVQATGDNVSVFAQTLSDTLLKYTHSKTKGIVLDLRLNGGGQFSSMVAGLAPLLGNVYLGGGVNSDEIQTMTFKLKNGNIYLNDNQRTSIKHQKNLDLTKIPVAIIIGPATRSSGSILAISFKGRGKTILIGENTASGYTTSNDYFQLGIDLFLNLSTTNSIDRNNKVYKDIVEPDIIIKGEDNFNSVKNDNKVKVAMKWLKNNSR
jgi:carboxyl-terminal processing protease